MNRRIKGIDWLILILDIFIVNMSYFFALILRFYMLSGQRESFAAEDYPALFLKIAPIYTILCIVVFYILRMYNGMWRYAGINDMNRIIIASAITCIAQYVISILILYRRMPYSYYVVGAMIQFFGVSFIRFFYRLRLVEQRIYDNWKKKGSNTLVVGVGEAARHAIRSMEEGKKYRPVCVLDAKESEYERTMNGIPVQGGLGEIDKLFDRYNIRYVVIADSLMQPDVRKSVENVCEDRKIPIIDLGYSYYLGWNGEDIPDQDHAEEATSGQAAAEIHEEFDKIRAIPFSPPDISEAEIKEVRDALESGWITTGPRTKLLEKRLADFIETRQVVCLSSATAAEELNLRVLGIGAGDEVIVPAYTYTATASAAIHCGAKVVFVDIKKDGDPDTHMPEPDYQAIENAITPKTKAIVMVDLAGIPADYDKVFEIVNRKKDMFTPVNSDGSELGDISAKLQRGIGTIAVLSDAAHALGASRVTKYAGDAPVGIQEISDSGTQAVLHETEKIPTRRSVGRIAHLTSYSFHAVKNFTTAEGGAATWCLPQSVYDAGITDAMLYKMYQLLSLHGQSKDALAKTNAGAWEYDIVAPWYKCNMTDIMAAIGLRQLDRYSWMLDRRRKIIGMYDKTCDELGLSHLIHYTDKADSSGHLYLVRVPEGSVTRDDIIRRMADAEISTNVHYKPLPMMSGYKRLGWDIADFPNSYDYYHNLFTLPLHTLLTDEDVKRICDTLGDIVRGK